jgi:two-component system NarL family sensor kinase
MIDFTWNIVIAYLALFLVLSVSLYSYTKEKSFKYYAFYNVALLLYILSKSDYLYKFAIDNIISIFFNPTDADLLLKQGNWYIQVVFYNFYFIFSIYFLDLEKLAKVATNRIQKTLMVLFVFFSILFIVTFYFEKFELFFYLFQFLYLPSVLLLFVYLLPKAIKYSGNHKYFFLTGLSFYILFALLSFVLTIYTDFKNPLRYFLSGIIIENFCFVTGLAYKIKLVNEESQKTKAAILLEKQNREIAKLEALIDGEENERRRIAQELHDGLNGDLSAIKYRLSTLEESGLSPIDSENLSKVINMIDESCAQVRSISHNLMPASIVDYGLLETIREFCSKMNASQAIKIDFQSFGNPIELSQKSETAIYRIIQELVTNILKHSKATEAMIQFNYREDELFITVEDNGIGFDKNAISTGIGHKNIKTRINFLNAQLDVQSSSAGTSFTISIDLNKVK